MSAHTTSHILPKSTYYAVYAALMVMLLATVGAAYVDLGPFNFLVLMMIAVAKAVLIMLYFMHVRFSNKLTWVFSGASFFWLGILLILTMSDYANRLWLPIPGK